MKAAVCYEFGKPLVVEEVDIDPPQKGEVKIRLAATAICHSDINIIRGNWGKFLKLPAIPGHESAGYVVEVGEDVTLVKPGDAVIASILASCGRCPSCTSGLPHLCEAKWALDMESRVRNKRGQRPTWMKVSGCAEYAIVYESQLAVVSKDMPLDRACLLACGVITGFGAVVNRAQVKPLSSVVILGTGGVGLNSVQGAAFVGAYPVIAVDISDKKLEAARIFGATHTINAKKEDAVKAVRELMFGRGPEYAFVTGGGADALSQAFAMVGRRGTVVLVTLTPMSGAIPFAFDVQYEFVSTEKTFIGCHMGSTRLSVDMPRLVALYQAGRLKLDELITGRYPLEQINEAIESVERGEALRNVIVF